MVSLRALFGKDADILHDDDFQALLLAGLTAPLGAALLSPLLGTLTDPLGVSSARIGLLMSAFTAPSIFLIPIAGVISDRVGRKPVLVAGLVLFGIGGCGLAGTTDFEVAILLRLLQGVGGAGILPVIITSIGDIYTGTAETTAQGFRFTSSGVTQTVFPAIAGFLVAFGWQYPLLLYGIAFLMAGVVVVVLEEPSGRRGPTDRTDHAPDSDGEAFLEAVRRRQVLGLLVVYGIPPALYIGFLTYISIVVARLLGGTPAQAGLLVAVMNVVKAVAASQAGRIAAWFDRQVVLLAAANVLLGGGLATVALAPSVLVVGAGVVLLGGGSGVLMSLYRSLLTRLSPGRVRGSMVSVGESIITLGMTVFPIVAGATIAFAQSAIGFGVAVRWTLFGLAVGGVAFSVTVLLMAHPFESP
ncbi:MFS transporter [Salinirubellus sp. GCM10025818]|uniref:MFS transporter n=1 Tax=Salinirubellus TaxID=2162630 RepID=UPI0030D49B30